MLDNKVVVRQLGLQAYEPIWHAMQSFTNERQNNTSDELWCLQHLPVFTQGQNGKPEHILNPGDIPVVHIDRGGQVTYHGPGQLVIYTLANIRRKNWGVRNLVTHLENAVIACLKEYDITAHARRDAPGVYVESKKICSLGLRIRRGCSYHGLALNVKLSLEPFTRINPCGLERIQMTQISGLGGPDEIEQVNNDLVGHICREFGYNATENYESLE